MKIIFFIHSLTSGGAERVLSLLANNWHQQHHEITVAVNNTDTIFYTLDKSINILNIAVEQSKGFTSPISTNLSRVKKIKQVIDDIDPDVVIGFMTSMNINVTIAAKLAGKPIIISERNNYHFIKSFIWRTLRRVIYPFSDTLIVQTSYDHNKYSYHPNAHIIENPLVVENTHCNIQREKIILAVGRLHVDKGFDMLIEAFNLLKSKSNWKLEIIGEGSERENLEARIKSLKLKEYISLPGVSSDVELHYKKASIFVLSSRGEGFPNVLCEAMSYGCPSISFDCLTGPSDIIKHDENGLLIQAEDVNALSDSLQYLMCNHDKRKLLSSNAFKISESLDIEKISNKWLAHIEEIIT